MSHIPASRMPHAHAHDDHEDGKSAQPNQAQPAPEPTTAVPPASASGASPASGGEFPGGTAGTVSGGASDGGGATSSAGANSTGGSEARSGPVNGPSARDDADDRSPYAIAAMVIGGLAVVGGIVATLTPFLVARDEPKSKKRKKRKSA